MASDMNTADYRRLVLRQWHIGVGTGIAGVIPMILFSTTVGGKELFPLFGLIPFAVLWGLLYAGIATINRIEQLATEPLSGVVLGVVYSFLVWWGPQVGKPIEEYVSINAALQVAFFGIVIGLIYAYSADVT